MKTLSCLNQYKYADKNGLRTTIEKCFFLALISQCNLFIFRVYALYKTLITFDVCVRACVRVCVCMCVHVSVSVHVRVHVSVCVCMSVFVSMFYFYVNTTSATDLNNS